MIIQKISIKILMNKKIDQSSQSQQDYTFRQKSDTSSNLQQIQLVKEEQCFLKNITKQNQFFSPYSNHYHQYFKDVQPEVEAQMIECLQDHKRRLEYKLVLLKQDSKIISFEKPLIHLVGSLYNGSVMLYKVVIGNYKLQIKLLNLNLDAPKNLKQLGSGGYGSVYQINYRKDKFIVCKRIVFKYHQTLQNENEQTWKIRPNPNDINNIITEYCIYKICSFYKIGPRVHTAPGFDLVCYNDSVQFYMEPCIELSGDYEKLEQNLKVNLFLLHKLKIIHKDIKTSNILYSPSYNRFILADFGISHPVKEEIGQLSKTYRQGTIEFMSEEMKGIKQHKAEYIDLYYNDLFGLTTSLKKLRKNSPNKLQGPTIYLESIKISQQYFHIYFLAHILMKDKTKIVEILELLTKQKKIIKSPMISSQFNELYEIVFDVISQRQLDINIFNIFTIQDSQRLSLEFLIRCNGLSKKLQYKLQKLKQTTLILKILNQTSPKQYSFPLFNYQAMHLMKYNQKQYFLIRNIHTLEAQREKHIQCAYEYNRQIFNNLYYLYNTIIIKPAKFTHSLLEILNKLSIYQHTQQEKTKYFLCLISKYKKLGLPQLYLNKIADTIAKNHPQYMVQLFQVLKTFVYDKMEKIRCYNRCLSEYYKDQNKYYKKILETLSLIVYYYYQIDQIGKSNQLFKKIQQQIRQYKLAPEKSQTVLLIELKILGQYHKQQGNFDIALQYYTNYLNKLIQQEGYKYEKIALWYYEIGICYLKLFKYQQAESNLSKAIKLIEFFDENYSYDNFTQLCNMQLVFIYLVSNRIEKAEDCIKKVFFKNELKRIHENNKFLEYDEKNYIYVIRSIQQLILKELKQILDQKTTNLLKTFDQQSQENCIHQLMIFKEEFYYFLDKRSYHKNLKIKIEMSKINNMPFLFLQEYIQNNNDILLTSIQLVVRQYLGKQLYFSTFNLMLTQLLKQFSQHTMINYTIPINFYKYLYKREYDLHNNQPSLAIIYLKMQYQLLKKAYSYQFIICAHRLSMMLFKTKEYHQCIYYTMQIINILQTPQLNSKYNIRQFYRRIWNIHLLMRDNRRKKIQYLKQKEIKKLKKNNRKIYQQWALIYLRSGSMDKYMLMKQYLRIYLKSDMKNKIHMTYKIKKHESICGKIMKQGYEKSEIDQQIFRCLKYEKLFSKLQLKHEMVKNNLKKTINNNIYNQILTLNKY